MATKGTKNTKDDDGIFHEWTQIFTNDCGLRRGSVCQALSWFFFFLFFLKRRVP
ncbi:MAG TPA: hypothetical protein VHQ47_08540 [Phycisphaerae bacterium]|nr:hypothetical protein [Phycisphaerae bacterium]